MRWPFLAVPVLSGCAILSTARPAAVPVVWEPFRLAHIAHPRLGEPGAADRLQAAARALSGERYLAAIVVAGELGAPPGRVAELLAPSGCALVVVGAGDEPLTLAELNRDLAVAALPSHRRNEAAAAVRRLESRLRGRWACAAAGWDPRGDAGLTYALESIERLRAVLLPGTEDAVDRRAALLYISTAPLAAGHVRLIDVHGRRLRTWLRPLSAEGDPAQDLPPTEVQTR